MADTGYGVLSTHHQTIGVAWSKATIGETASVLPTAVAEDLFRRLTVDTVYPHLAQPLLPISLDELRDWGTVVPAVLRTVPLFGETQRYQDLPFARHDRLDYQGPFDGRVHLVKELMTGAIGQDMHTAPTAELGGVMQRIQLLNNHPYFQELFQHGQVSGRLTQRVHWLGGLERAAVLQISCPAAFIQVDREGLQANLSEPVSAWLHNQKHFGGTCWSIIDQIILLGLEQLPKDQPLPLVKRLLAKVFDVIAKQHMTEVRQRRAQL